MENITEMLKGVLEGCVLEIIGRQETYGYEIRQRLNGLGFTEVVDGTVYTILVRLEKNKLVNIEKKPSELGPPRKFYSLNSDGRKELELFWKKWRFVSEKINTLKDFDEANVSANKVAKQETPNSEIITSGEIQEKEVDTDKQESGLAKSDSMMEEKVISKKREDVWLL